MTWNAFQYRDLAFAAKFFRDEFSGQFAALIVVRTDEGCDLSCRFAHGLGIHTRIYDDYGNARAVCLFNGRDNFPRSARRDTQSPDFGLDQVLYDLHLLFDVNL